MIKRWSPASAVLKREVLLAEAAAAEKEKAAKSRLEVLAKEKHTEHGRLEFLYDTPLPVQVESQEAEKGAPQKCPRCGECERSPVSECPLCRVRDARVDESKDRLILKASIRLTATGQEPQFGCPSNSYDLIPDDDDDPSAGANQDEVAFLASLSRSDKKALLKRLRDNDKETERKHKKRIRNDEDRKLSKRKKRKREKKKKRRAQRSSSSSSSSFSD